jgi:hypothetical protein
MSRSGTDQSGRRRFVLASRPSCLFAVLLGSGGGVSSAHSQDLSTVIAAMSTPLAYIRTCEAQFGGLRPGILDVLRDERRQSWAIPLIPKIQASIGSRDR